jgi:RNA polymerase sigma factor (sigma-70 family)
MENNDLLISLRKRENSSYAQLYKFYYRSIEKFVVANSGTAADAQDIFQETILVLLDKVPDEKFILTSSIKTYIHAVASNLWLKKLRDNKRILLLKEDDLDIEDLSFEAWEEREDNRVKRSQLDRMLHKVTRHCFIFLTKTFFAGISRDELIKELGYKNTHTFDNQKYKCLQQARKNYQPEG